MANKAVITLAAFSGKCIEFGVTKAYRKRTVIKVEDLLLMNISQQMIRIDEMVTVIQVTIRFKRQGMSAFLSMYT